MVHVSGRSMCGTCCPAAPMFDRSNGLQIDTSGLAVITLEYLLEREWVAEEQICEDLGQHHKIMRRALKFLEQVCHTSSLLPHTH